MASSCFVEGVGIRVHCLKQSEGVTGDSWVSQTFAVVPGVFWAATLFLSGSLFEATWVAGPHDAVCDHLKVLDVHAHAHVVVVDGDRKTHHLTFARFPFSNLLFSTRFVVSRNGRRLRQHFGPNNCPLQEEATK